ncbi:NAD-dependent epimerase/dehydratase family protein [Solimonas marina]|uniref:NAD-dependent epimerase/dehydratase family protein n=1 Tax=Solimonas marina TaxID=2714601 RepID=A0A969W5E8_9GAMM|nr:NAD-dependent epimerase/dehydratase family protein [Solimonas marina]NKF20912.1 NAD-dependent epimerase/dehydratase family protein [Solimonas marina]
MSSNVGSEATVVVTGGAGFIGSHTVELLLQRGYRVRVLDNFSTGHRHNLPNSENLEIFADDIRDHEALRTALRGATACLHLAAQVSVQCSIEAPAESATHNVVGLINVLDAAADQKVPRVVYASSAAVYGDPQQLPLTETAATVPISPYGLDKLVDEQYARLFMRLHPLSTMGLRYFNVYGPRQDPRSPYSGVISKFLDVVARGESPKIYGDGLQTRDFVYVQDIAAANVAALESRETGVLNVASGNAVDLLSVVDTLAALTGRPITPRHYPPRDGDIRDSRADITQLRTRLGMCPQWALADGLRQLLPQPLIAAA